jgi:hypothetical protein
MTTLDRPGGRFHWCWLAWFYHYYWAWHPAITDDFGNLVRFSTDKALYFINGWGTGARTRGPYDD